MLVEVDSKGLAHVELAAEPGPLAESGQTGSENHGDAKPVPETSETGVKQQPESGQISGTRVFFNLKVNDSLVVIGFTIVPLVTT